MQFQSSDLNGEKKKKGRGSLIDKSLTVESMVEVYIEHSAREEEEYRGASLNSPLATAVKSSAADNRKAIKTI